MLWFYAPHCHACYNVFHYVFDDCSYSCIIAIISVIYIFVYYCLICLKTLYFYIINYVCLARKIKCCKYIFLILTYLLYEGRLGSILLRGIKPQGRQLQEGLTFNEDLTVHLEKCLKQFRPLTYMCSKSYEPSQSLPKFSCAYIALLYNQPFKHKHFVLYFTTNSNNTEQVFICLFYFRSLYYRGSHLPTTFCSVKMNQYKNFVSTETLLF